MSAITGIFSRDGCPVSLELIKRMNNSLSQRGPDGSGIWFDGPVALGHQMLHTTPESINEKLPFEDPETGLVITADARIDNRAELAPLLGLDNVKDVSDSLYILNAYHKWGEKCPEKLLGDFAFVIWNPKKEQLFCARDHMGIKPFYYYLSDDNFFFATELKALLTNSEVSLCFNELKIAYHLMNIPDKNATFYNNILSLIASHSITISKNYHKVNEFWKLDPESEIVMDSNEEYIQAFKKIFTESIRCRLRSVFPIGFELSGGLDSSSIVCTSRLLYNKYSPSKSINTFSFIFDDFANCDERYYINKVVEEDGFNPHYVNADKINPLGEIETIMRNQDQPFFSPNIAIIWNLYKEMQNNKIRINISGLDGDSVISYGQNYLKELAITLKWNKLIKEIRTFSKNQNLSSFDVFNEKVVFKLIPHHIKKILATNKSDARILNKNFSNKINAGECLDNLKLIPRNQANTPKKYHYYILNPFTHKEGLEMGDRLNAEFSMEPRYPFYDKRLVEFCYAIPTEMKFKDGWGRYIQRKAMDNILPPEIQWRLKKTDFRPVFEKNLLSFGRTYLDKMVYGRGILEDYVDLDELEEIYHNYKLGSIGSDLIVLWLVTTLYFWLNIDFNSYIDEIG